MKKGLAILACVIGVVLAGLLTIYIFNVRKDKEASDYLNRGLAKYNRGDYQGAVSDFDAALQINPDYAEAYNNRGLTQAALGQYQQAIADYERALQINPDYAEAYNNRGLTQAALGQYQQAIADYERALQINPDYAEAYNNRGHAKAALGDYKGAISDYDTALAMDPGYAEAYKNRAKAKIELGDYKGAVSDFDTALRLEPDDAEAYKERAKVKIELGDYKGAVSDFDTALRLEPDDAEAYKERAKAKIELGDYKGAVSDLDAALRLEPDDAEAYSNRAKAKIELGDYKGAVSDLDAALRLEPDDAEAYKERAKAKIELGDYKGAVSDLDAALRLEPDDAEAYSNRAKAKIELGDYKGAVSDLDAALRLEPDDTQAYKERAKAKIELGDYKGAVSDLDTALRLDPDDTQAYTDRDMAQAAADGMVLILAGEFQMGTDEKPTSDKDKILNVYEHGIHTKSRSIDYSPYQSYKDSHDHEKPVHTVYLDAFYIDKYEVTNAQYKEFVDANPEWSKTNIDKRFHDGDYLQLWERNTYPSWKANHPVVYVSWYAAMAYAEWAGKRLPTEAEWEKAARGGLTGKAYPWGNSIDPSKANYKMDFAGTLPVGTYSPNNFGLYDITGNVWEWCLDEYDRDFYKNSPRRNPIADADANSIAGVLANAKMTPPENLRQFRQFRGGSFRTNPLDVRVSLRAGGPTVCTISGLGFRCVRDTRDSKKDEERVPTGGGLRRNTLP